MKKKLLLAFVCAGMLSLPLAANTRVEAAPSTSTANQNGWVTNNGKKYYYIDGKKATGLTTIASKNYYFDTTTGEMKTGFVFIGSRKYYFKPDTGEEHFGWLYYNKRSYYFCKKGYALKGLQKLGSYTYYFDYRGILVKNSIVLGKYYTNERGRLTRGWVTIGDKKYYFSGVNYEMLTGWKSIGGKMYYFNSDGTLKKLSGIVTASNKYRYYYSPDTGEMVTGWVTPGKYTYYFSKTTGRAFTGWHTIGGKKYYFNSKGVLIKNYFVSKKYYVNEKGELMYGWFDANGKTYYSSTKTGILYTQGWHTIGGKKYYFNADKSLAKNTWLNSKQYLDETGAYATGFKEIDGKTYYFNPTTKNKVTGWRLIGGKAYKFSSTGVLQKLSGIATATSGHRYYFDTKTGEMVTGWVTPGRYTYYFNPYAYKGWHTIDGKTYYFNAKGVLLKSRFISNKYYVNDKGEKVYRWQTINGKKYYFSSSTGAKITGWKTIGAYRYYFDSTGVLQTDKWIGSRYVQSNGAMAKSTWIGAYYVNASGVKTTQTRSPGLFVSGGKTYLLDSNYEYLTGWQTYNGKTYHFDTTTGVMDKSKWIDGYYVDANGVRSSGSWTTINGVNYLFLSDGTKAMGLVEYEGNKYYFSTTDGAQQTGFKVVDGVTYYFNPSKNGAMAVSTEVLIDGIYYTFDATGHMTAKIDATMNEALGQRIAAYAQNFIGYPYVWGGDQDLTKGVDCSGFTMLVYKYFGITIPRTTWTQHDGVSGYKTPIKIAVEDLKPGDLIFYYAGNTHVAIYIGDGKVVHASNSAPYPQGGIKISNYDMAYIYGCVRYWYNE